MTEQLLLESVPLNALDRCDRCGAQAYVRAVLLNGGELMFCAHHGKEYAEKLKTVAAKIQDETEKLIESKNQVLIKKPSDHNGSRVFYCAKTVTTPRPGVSTAYVLPAVIGTPFVAEPLNMTQSFFTINPCADASVDN